MYVFLNLLFLVMGFSYAQEPGLDPNIVTEVQNGVLPFAKRDVDKMLAPFRYTRLDKRDPFLLPEGKIPLSSHGLFGPFTWAQELSLDDIQLKGVLIHPKNPKALLKIKDGGIIKVGVKDYVGENFGYVAAIRPGKVIIVQTKEQNGERYSTTRTLSIEK